MELTRGKCRTARLAILIVALAGFGSAAFADGAFASHFRYTSVTWTETGANTADFTVSSSFRRCGYSGTAGDGCPAVGDVITEFIGGTSLNFGDSSSTGTLSYRVTAINPSEDWLIGLAIDPAGGGPTDNLIGHTYAGPGPFTAQVAGCCTIFTLNNNNSGSYGDATLVDFANEDESAVTSVPPIVTVGKPGVQNFPVPAIDSGGETLRWRLATAAEACGGCFDPQPPGLTINPTTGIISWDTTTAATGLWFTSVVIESLDGAGNIVSSIQVTFLINVVTGTNQPPDWDSPPTPPQSSEFTVNCGSPLTIQLQASDPDSGDTVHIDNLGLPAGATFNSTDGNPATATFSWTPTAGDVGDHLVTFTAQDNGTPQQSAQARTYIIHVTCGPTTGPPATLTLSPSTATNRAGEQHCVTATVEDANGNPNENVVVQFAVSGANSASGSGTTDANGQATFCYTGTNAGNDTINAFADVDNDGVDDGASEPDDTASKTYVAADPATLDLTPATATNVVDSQHCVTAHVEDAFGNPTPGITVEFSTSGSTSASGDDTTDSNGDAAFCYTGPALPGADTISAFADTNGNGTDDGASEPDDTAQKTWTLPTDVTPCVIKITNGGWIITDDGDRGSFGGNAKESATGVDTGQQQYTDHGPAEPMNVHSLNVLAITCDTTLTKASIFGQATIDGTGSYFYRIDVEDNGEPGKLIDHYRIRLSNGYDSGDHILRGGNVQIH